MNSPVHLRKKALEMNNCFFPEWEFFFFYQRKRSEDECLKEDKVSKSLLDYLSGPFFVGMKLFSSRRFWSSPGHLSFRYVPPASADGPAKGTRGGQKKIIGSRAGVPP